MIVKQSALKKVYSTPQNEHAYLYKKKPRIAPGPHYKNPHHFLNHELTDEIFKNFSAPVIDIPHRLGAVVS